MRKERFHISPITRNHHAWIKEKLIEYWGTTRIVTRHKMYNATDLPGFIVYEKEQPVGLITYFIQNRECEIITINSFKEQRGVATLLLKAVNTYAREQHCQRIWLITTNDNLKALGFFQKRGFRLVAIYPDALKESRRLKPEIPDIGLNNIPLRDEIELELLL
jgi:N-acetylglutamate synthase-like GNAT family acetyltransferase